MRVAILQVCLEANQGFRFHAQPEYVKLPHPLHHYPLKQEQECSSLQSKYLLHLDPFHDLEKIFTHLCLLQQLHFEF